MSASEVAIATLMSVDVLEAAQKYARAGVPPNALIDGIVPPTAALLMASTVQLAGGRFDIDAWNKTIQQLADSGIAWLAKNHPEAFRKEEVNVAGTEEPPA